MEGMKEWYDVKISATTDVGVVRDAHYKLRGSMI